MGWLTENWTLGHSRELEEDEAPALVRDLDLGEEHQRLSGIAPGRTDWVRDRLTEAEMDAIEFNTQLSKELKKLRKDAGAKSIKQNYRGTGKQKFRRQLWVRFKNGAVIDLWLNRDRLGLGGTVKRRADDSKAPQPLPGSVPYESKSPAEVYRAVAPLLKRWAEG